MSSQMHRKQQTREARDKQPTVNNLRSDTKQGCLKQFSQHQSHLYNYHHPYPYEQRSLHWVPQTIPQLVVDGDNSNKSVAPHTHNQNAHFSAASTGAPTMSIHTTTTPSNACSRLSFQYMNSSIKTMPPCKESHTPISILMHSEKKIGSKKLKTEPVLSYIQQSERLKFANTHISWNEDQWKRVLFQDERKFNLDGPDGYASYYHDLRNYERSLTQRPRGYSVYVYALITAKGPVHLEVSSVKFPITDCIDTILKEKQNILTKLGDNQNIILQDHNWTAYVLPNVEDWLLSEGIKNQKWPTIAHDINIMENVWGWLIREVYDSGRKFSRKDDLIFSIKEAWSRLPVDLLTNLYSTMPERIMELYYTRGAYTNC